MKTLKWLKLAGSPAQPGKNWVPFLEYPKGAKLLAIEDTPEGNDTQYGGLFELEEVPETEKRSFRVLRAPALSKELALPEGAQFCFTYVTPGSMSVLGGLFGATQPYTVYEVPWDCQELIPPPRPERK